MKVEMAALGSPPLIVLTASVDVKQTELALRRGHRYAPTFPLAMSVLASLLFFALPHNSVVETSFH